MEPEREIFLTPLFLTSPASEQDLVDLLEPTWHPDSNTFYSLVTGPERKSQTVLSTPNTLPPASAVNTLFSLGKSALDILSIYRADFDGPSPYPLLETNSWNSWNSWGTFTIFDSHSSQTRTILVVDDDWQGPGASEYRSTLAQYEENALRENGFYCEPPTDEDYAALDALVVSENRVVNKTVFIARGARAKRVPFADALNVAREGLAYGQDEDDE